MPTSVLAGTAFSSEQPTSTALQILSTADAERYRRIFHTQKKGHWKDADKIIATIDDPILMGYVQYQRYMHPTAWRSSYKELSNWLATYSDHPGATRVYRLALRRHPRGAARPTSPSDMQSATPSATSSSLDPSTTPDLANEIILPEPRISPHYNNARRKITSLLQRGRPTQALATLTRDWLRYISAPQADNLRGRIAGAYFFHNKYAETLKLASGIVNRAGDSVPLANWYGGLASWQVGRSIEAAKFFTPLANSPHASAQLRSAGAYWAARVWQQMGDNALAQVFLKHAAAQNLNFYSLLAAHKLRRKNALFWSPPPPAGSAIDDVIRDPAVVRAIALVETGWPEMAEYELMNAYHRLSPPLRQTMLALAHHLNLPASQVHIAQTIPQETSGKLPSTHYTHTSLYPIPSFEPDGGFLLDRALVYAVIRQESRFKSRAKSRSGARGLMQILPSTAGYITKDRSLVHHRRHDLYEPPLNLALGQKYMAMLLEKSKIPNNLFMVTAAWNGGPRRVQRWLADMDHKNDPLVFVESIPFPETRNFVKRVMTNLWVYRNRLGQPAPSLAMVTEDQWPLYQSLETSELADTQRQ